MRQLFVWMWSEKNKLYDIQLNFFFRKVWIGSRPIVSHRWHRFDLLAIFLHFFLSVRVTIRIYGINFRISLVSLYGFFSARFKSSDISISNRISQVIFCLGHRPPSFFCLILSSDCPVFFFCLVFGACYKSKWYCVEHKSSRFINKYTQHLKEEKKMELNHCSNIFNVVLCCAIRWCRFFYGPTWYLYFFLGFGGSHFLKFINQTKQKCKTDRRERGEKRKNNKT